MGFLRSSSHTSAVIVGFVVLLCGFNSVPVALGQSLCPTILTTGNGVEKTFTICQHLPAQGATFSWTLIPGENTSNGIATGWTLDLAYRATLPSAGGWVGWGINPATDRMGGSSVLIAFNNASGGSVVLQYRLDESLYSTGTSNLVPGATDLDVLQSSVEIDGTSLQATIYAALLLKPGQTNLYQVWNRGTSVVGLTPQPHDFSDTSSHGRIDVATGAIVASSSDRAHRRNRHGIINAVAWGILLPAGVIAARYMRSFSILDPAWFYIHVTCQVSGYILGVAGWALGLKLITNGVVHHKHRNIGISLFALATLQMFALVLRPKPGHKYRKFWNVYHYAIGYIIIILSIVNIFEGFDLLMPAKGWKRAYIGIIIGLGTLALVLEVFTWAVWFKRKSNTSAQRIDDGAKDTRHAANGTGNGFHDGYDHRLDDQSL